MNERYARQEAALTTLMRRYASAPDDFTPIVREVTEVVARTLEVAQVSVWRHDDRGTSTRCQDLFEWPDDAPLVRDGADRGGLSGASSRSIAELRRHRRARRARATRARSSSPTEHLTPLRHHVDDVGGDPIAGHDRRRAVLQAQGRPGDAGRRTSRPSRSPSPICCRRSPRRSSGSGSSSSSGRRRSSKPSASSPAAWRTTSTTS